jgi:hypothetical protein
VLPRSLSEAAVLWSLTLVAVDRLTAGSRRSRSVALLLLTLVPISANRKIARTLSEEEVFAPSKLARVLSRLDPQGAYRTLSEAYYIPGAGPLADPADAYVEGSHRSWVEFTQALWGRGTVFNKDFDVGDFSRLNSLRKLAILAARSPDSTPFFQSFSLRFGVRYRGQSPLAGYRPFSGDVRQEWDLLDGAEPDIRFARSWVEAESGMAAANLLPRLREGAIVLETGRRAIGRGGAGALRVVQRDPEHLVIETESAMPGWLVVLRGFWNHRSVEIDGRPVEYVPAQLAFTAVSVPPGRHRIEWRELVPGGAVSRFGPILWAAFTGALMWFPRSQQER